MTDTPSPHRILRRSRAVGWTTAAGASLATVGLIAGVTHTASQAATPTTSTSTTTTNGSTVTTTPTTATPTVTTPTTATGNGGVTNAPANQPAQGGSNGS